jgi:hypothetical protein
MRSLNLRRAYTIAELVIVIAIILLIVSLSSYALMSARKAADGIVSEAEAALQSGLGGQSPGEEGQRSGSRHPRPGRQKIRRHSGLAFAAQ